MRPISVTRPLSLFALAGSVCLMAACGLDPPPADGKQAATAGAGTPTSAGLALATREGWKVPAANGPGVRCNIETLAGETLEAVHPTVAADTAVTIQGWYAFPAAAAAAPAAPTTGQATEGTAAAAAAAPSKPILVIASENGINHWVVALPELSERRDVAKAFDDPLLSKSGFDVALDLSGLRPGFYSMHLSDDAHGDASVCGLGRGFVIK